MLKKITANILSLLLVISFASFAWSFESNANFDESTPNKTDQREYTRENAAKPVDQGGYYGGHDTIMGEAALLKKEVHNNNQDFKTWLNEQALPNLRTGAHDEDSKKFGIFGYIGGDAPIGPNGNGDYFKHFYNPNNGKGLWGNESAIERAMNYANDIKKKLGRKQYNFSRSSQRNKGKITHISIS